MTLYICIAVVFASIGAFLPGMANQEVRVLCGNLMQLLIYRL